ncbi:MAG TPA: hypothetical protein DCS93_42540 [Microscillaceae bacterium]|nr:hypothetical protein [Microscillaceae bacterium]
MTDEKLLSTLATIVRGSSPRPKGDPRYYGGSIPRLMVSDVSRDGMYVTPQIDFLTEEGAKKSRPMKKGDVIIAVSGDPGEPCILNVDACIHDGFVGLRDLDTKLIFSPYLYQYLKLVKERNKAQAVGAIYKNLNTDQIKKIKIPLPPLSTQQHIAQILDKADTLRQKDQALLAHYDQLAQSLFLEMFGDPVLNPKGWNMIQFNTVLKNIENGWSPVCEPKSRNSDEQWAVLKLGAVTYRTYNSLDHKVLPKSEAGRPEIEVKKGDLLFTRKNTYELVGASAFVFDTPPKLMLPDTIFRLNYDIEKSHPLFLYFLINHQNYRKEIQRLASGTSGSMPNISKGKLMKKILPLPPIELQNQFAERIASIEAQKAIAQKAAEQSEALFQSLLQRAFKGELVE